MWGSHAAVERGPSAQDLGPDGADDRNRSDDDQAGHKCVFQHFAALLIVQQPSEKGVGFAHTEILCKTRFGCSVGNPIVRKGWAMPTPGRSATTCRPYMLLLSEFQRASTLVPT